MKYHIENNEINLAITLDCGQCFRWEQTGENAFSAAVAGCAVTALQLDGGFEITDSADLGERFWRKYFDTELDYDGLITRFSADDTLKNACTAARGIHILKQEPFETLISFIISQNNNIPRIKGIIGRLCEAFGEKVAGGLYAFPSADTLAGLSEAELAPLRAGFRARYIIDAARKISDKTVDFEQINSLPTELAREELKKIVGVGDKVADCTLLFGFHKLNAFPKDVWIKRVVAEYYPGGLPECMRGFEGVAQQYLFEYARGRG